MVKGQGKEQQEIQGDVLFADTLAKYLTKKLVGNKEQLKWNGGLSELMDFVTFVLKPEGKWKQSRAGGKQKPDQPPHLKHTFQDSKLNITVHWWWSSKTLLFQGGQKRIIEIEKTVFSLLGDTNLEVEEATEKTDPEQNSSSDSSGEIQDKRIENLWDAVEEIKVQLSLLVPSSSVNPPNDPKIIIEGKKKIIF